MLSSAEREEANDAALPRWVSVAATAVLRGQSKLVEDRLQALGARRDPEPIVSDRLAQPLDQNGIRAQMGSVVSSECSDTGYR
jgi:hypothetical protein